MSFFERYYRPEYTTIVVAGDVDSKRVRALAEQFWGSWKRGSYQPDIPAEPVQKSPRENHVDWPSSTLPLIAIAYKGPAFTDTQKDWAALDVLATLAFSRTSDLYQKLVVNEQKADMLDGEMARRVDPNLFEVDARIKRADDVQYVRDQILDTIKRFQNDLVQADKLAAVKNRDTHRMKEVRADSVRAQIHVSLQNSIDHQVIVVAPTGTRTILSHGDRFNAGSRTKSLD